MAGVRAPKAPNVRARVVRAKKVKHVNAPRALRVSAKVSVLAKLLRVPNAKVKHVSAPRALSASAKANVLASQNLKLLRSIQPKKSLNNIASGHDAVLS